MGRVKKRFPDFIYKRAAVDPINPINQADASELQMLALFYLLFNRHGIRVKHYRDPRGGSQN
jgi:hypothetical protein